MVNDVMPLVSATVMSSLIAVFALVGTRILVKARAWIRYQLLTLVMVALAFTVVGGKLVDIEIPLHRPQAVTEFEDLAGPNSRSLTVSAETAPWVKTLERSLLIVWVVGFCVTGACFGWRLRKYTWYPLPRNKVLTNRMRNRLSRSPRPELKGCANRVVVSDAIECPCVVGMLMTRIALPMSCLDLDERTLETVVFHERNHLYSGDQYRSLLTCVIVAVFWFNPLIWLLSKRLFVEREQACDEQVVAGLGLDYISYFERILHAVRSQPDPSPVPAIGAKRQLVSRIEWMTAFEEHRGSERHRIRRALVIGLLLLVCSALPWCRVSLAKVHLLVVAHSPVAESVAD